MKYFLDYLDIESMIVVGSANGENHAWNIVNIDGDYYHIDATWDDPVTDDGTDTIIYDYFNLKDKDIEKKLIIGIGINILFAIQINTIIIITMN